MKLNSSIGNYWMIEIKWTQNNKNKVDTRLPKCWDTYAHQQNQMSYLSWIHLCVSAVNMAILRMFSSDQCQKIIAKHTFFNFGSKSKCNQITLCFIFYYF